MFVPFLVNVCYFQVLTGLVLKSNPSLLTLELMTEVMVGVVQQAVEKIDRTRAHAGKVFRSLLHRSAIKWNAYTCIRGHVACMG